MGPKPVEPIPVDDDSRFAASGWRSQGGNQDYSPFAILSKALPPQSQCD
jgi:hypothetical protein